MIISHVGWIALLCSDVVKLFHMITSLLSQVSACRCKKPKEKFSKNDFFNNSIYETQWLPS